jgi:methionine-rich copper-binding protein CopC
VAFNSDGTKMFIVGWDGDDVNEYTLTTGFDVVNTTPTLSSSSPSDGATSVGVNDNIVLTFSEAVDAESGNIVIKKTSDDSTVETIDVTGAKVSGSGSTTITINPSTTLVGGTGYYITIAATAFDDVDSASYAGFSNSTTLNFTTENSTTDPLTDKDVVGSIEAQTETSKRILQHVTTPVLNRMDWLRRHRKEDNLTNQNIKFQFSNAMLASLSKVIPVATKVKVNEVSNLSDNWSFWSEGSISVGKIGDTSSASSKDIDSNGITIGMDKKIDENNMYGYALRFGRDEVEIGSSGTSLDTNAYSLSLYGTFPHDDTKFIDSVLGVSSLKTNHVRKSGSNTLTGERNGRQVFGSINFRTTYNKDKFNITPNGRIDLGYTELSEYSETGTDALIYDKQQIETGMASIGITLDDTIQFENTTFKTNGRLEYGANFSPSSDATVSYVSDPSTDYTLSIAHEATHNIRAGLGFDLITENGWTVTTNYERDQSDNSHSDTLYLGASYISNKETEYAMSLKDDKTFLNYKKNINGFNIKVSSNYNLMSEITEYGANLEISSKF